MTGRLKPGCKARWNLHKTAAAALLVAGLVLLAGCSLVLPALSDALTTTAPTALPTAAPGRPTSSPQKTQPAATQPAAAQSGLKIATPSPGDRMPTIAFARLPAEAQSVLRLIAAGGPFPYRQDGLTFENREGLLPKKASGYYREYTVETPGSSDRGARRIIAGTSGERYYTDDHYASFKQVIP